MKRNLLTFLLMLVSLLAFDLNAQTVDEIIDNYFETIGGKDKVAAIKSMKATCMAKAQGMDLPVVMYQSAPNKQRMDINFQGKEITQMAFNGDKGWGTNFMTMEAEEWDQQQSDITKSQMDFPDVFLDYKDKGYTLTLDGEEEVEGVQCFVLKLTRPAVMVDGKEEENVSYYYIDQENFVPIMQKSFAMAGPAKGAAVETYLSDYDEVEGIYFPFTIAQRMNGQDIFNISIQTIELNAEIPDSLFEMPEKAADGGGK